MNNNININIYNATLLLVYLPAPAASEINEAHAVLQSSALAVQLQHMNLALRQRGRRTGPVPRRVLQARTQDETIKLIWYLVVLVIGFVLLNCDIHCFKFFDESEFVLH